MGEDLIEKYAKLENINFKKAEKELKIFIDVLEKYIIKNKKATFRGIGKFRAFKSKPRYISNPVTREKMLIFPKTTVKFDSSQSFRKKF